jgi:hypothetical protein
MDFQWVVKHLNTDQRGYASDAYFEMQGTNSDGVKQSSSVAVSFGGDDLKPRSAWQQSDIDAYAETLRPNLEAQITEALEGQS